MSVYVIDPHESNTNLSRYRQYGTSTGVKQYSVHEVLRAVHTMKTFGAAPSFNVSWSLPGHPSLKCVPSSCSFIPQKNLEYIKFSKVKGDSCSAL